MNKRIFILTCYIQFFIVFKTNALNCPHPDADINTNVKISGLEPGKVATYTCDTGFQLFGIATRTCSEDGTWTGDAPMCSTNVAWRKPANQSSMASGGEARNANDGDLTTVHEGDRCTETQVQDSPWWSVDLLRDYEISHVRITTRSCCGDFEVQDLEVRVGDSANIGQRNKLCTWHPGILKKGETQELKCARPITGRYVTVQMVGVVGSLSLCEVEVFAREEVSKERCKGNFDQKYLGLFNGTCYEFQTISGGSFEIAQDRCRVYREGDLVHRIEPTTQKFLAGELQRLLTDSQVKMVWIGAQKEPKFTSRIWHWVDGTQVDSPSWVKDQPNNYNKAQNCVVLDGKFNWGWNDMGCNLNYLHWICQFKPSCGTPDRKLNSTFELQKSEVGEVLATYECPVGNKIEGDRLRNCSSTGFWSGEAPSCKYIDCGKPPSTENGVYSLIDSRTTYAARTTYVCAENYTLNGNDTVTCGDKGAWEPNIPKCLYSWCPELEEPVNGILRMNGRRSGDTATFGCEPGYFLVGQKTLSCVLGGYWSGTPPTCRFIDCGLPESMEHGKMNLINSTTYLGSIALYECEEDFWITGPTVRTCGTNGLWNGDKPYCELINCGKPEIPFGGIVTGYSFDVHNEVNYKCEPGHFMTGNPIRVCTREGLWSGEMPICTYVDCGHLPPIVKGELLYDTEEAPTYLDSEIHYKCMPNYRLIGNEIRVCLKSGDWSGETPRCEEIRCKEPNHPEKSRITYAGNDRRISLTLTRSRHNTNATYKVGSKVSYRCERGHVVEGENTRTCLNNGTWSGEPPKCRYIDCGHPPNVERGVYRLLNNETSYGAIVVYECEANWKIDGKVRRHCLENGTWSGGFPHCAEVLCPSLEEELERKYRDDDQREIEPWNKDLIEQRKKARELRIGVDDGDRRVGSSAYYKCAEGQKVIGEQKRLCKQHGVWDGSEPKCEWVKCEKPKNIENGLVHILDNEITFGSVAEYFCLPKFHLRGSFNRSCTSSGTWSGKAPICTLDDTDLGAFDVNTIDETSNLARGPLDESLDGASYTGLYVGIAVSFILVLAVGVTLFFFKAREKRLAAKSSSNGHSLASKPVESVPHPTVMTYGDLNDPTTGNNIYEHIPEDIDSNNSYANMSPTSSFTSTPPSSYSNIPPNHTYSNSGGRELHYANSNASSMGYVGGRRSPHDRIPSHISRRPRMPPPQPPPGGITPSAAGVTVNGVAVNSGS